MNGKARNYISNFYEKAIQIAEIYQEATGIECFVINNKGYRMSMEGAKDVVCPFCDQLNQICDNKSDCRQAHLYGGYQAERFGGSYIYFCPINMLHWASPLMEEGLMTGALIAGPALIIEPDELIEELKLKIDPAVIDKANMRSQLDTIPRLTTERAKALSEMLLISASHLIEGEKSALVSKKDSMDQQAQISEYIQYIKQMENKDAEISRYPIEKERDLLHLIQTGDSKEARKVLNEILGAVFFNSGGKFDVVKARVLELLVLLSRAAVEGGADAEQIFGMNYTYLNEINQYSSVEGLAGWLAGSSSVSPIWSST